MTKSDSGMDTWGPNPDSKEEPANEFRVIDRRHLDSESKPVGDEVEEKPRYPTFVEELMARLSQSEKRFEEKRKQVDEEIGKMKVRLEADYERKMLIEKQKAFLPLLEVLDNLERAVNAANKGSGADSLLAGLTMILDLFRSKLQEQEIYSIQVLDEPFDPNLGMAVGVVEVSEEDRDGVVVEELRKGYRMGDQLMRPAQVRVGKLEASAQRSTQK